ncbi:DUF3348 family protein [Lysobacter korlensis]|uniref:DUF3348 family protein n=1 Tax=Lysobacter korlensis TaxID=553636 RepID=A0ABV6RJR0_9GAMM
MESPARAQAHGPALIRLLAQISGTATPPPPASLASRLAQWVDWRQAVALSAALDARPASPAVGDDSHPLGDDGECARVRAALIRVIEGDRAFIATGVETDPPDAAFYRQRYVAMQQIMDADIRHLRGRMRARLTLRGGPQARLAAMDAVMEQALTPHERALLGPIADLLGQHFERLRQAAQTSPDRPAPSASTALRTSRTWLDVFRRDMQQLLHAELELRMQPTQGLLAALRTAPAGHHAQ